MSSSFRAAPIRDRGRHRQPLCTRIARLESDLDCFQARLEIMAEPRTSDQRARPKAFKLLHSTHRRPHHAPQAVAGGER